MKIERRFVIVCVVVGVGGVCVGLIVVALLQRLQHVCSACLARMTHDGAPGTDFCRIGAARKMARECLRKRLCAQSITWAVKPVP